MKTRLSVLALTLALLAPASAASTGSRRPFTPAETLALGRSSDADLGALRAGGLDTPTRLSASERAQLQLAEEQSLGLEQLRAGTDDSTIILIVLAVLILAILI